MVDDDDKLEDENTDPAVLQRLFWYRVLKAKEYAEFKEFRDLPVTKDMLDAASEAAAAWVKTAGKLRSVYHAKKVAT